MIPKIIHYCWLSKDPIPKDMQMFIDGWYEKLPDYEFMLWDFNRFDIHSSQWVKEAFSKKKYAFAADYIRLYALYNYGGIYMDMDVEVLKSFRLSIMLSPDIIPFKLTRKIERLNKERKYVPTRKIVDIQFCGASKMQCIKVSNSDGLYLCDDFIVTHNTGQTIATLELMDAFPALVITPASVKYNWKKEWEKWNPTRTVGVVGRKKKFDENV